MHATKVNERTMMSCTQKNVAVVERASINCYMQELKTHSSIQQVLLFILHSYVRFFPRFLPTVRAL